MAPIIKAPRFSPCFEAIIEKFTCVTRPLSSISVCVLQSTIEKVNCTL